MSLEEDFKKDPAAFLKTNVIVVPEATDDWYDEPGLYQFVLAEGGKAHLVELKPRIAITGDFIYAYYLPWAINEATHMTLGDAADFFFTSQMTNCRFSVLADNPKQPRVSHVAGNISRDQRNEKEITSKFVDGTEQTRLRKLSVSEVVKKKHKYRGQAGGLSSSAFTYGQRAGDGTWKFFAQITKGIMSAVNTMTEDLTILNYVDIMKL